MYWLTLPGHPRSTEVIDLFSNIVAYFCVFDVLRVFVCADYEFSSHFTLYPTKKRQLKKYPRSLTYFDRVTVDLSEGNGGSKGM